MKSVLIFALALILLVPLARTVLAAPAVDRPTVETTRVLLKGTIQSNESYTTVSPILYVTANGSGEATALGPFTISYHTEVNLDDFSEAETAHFTGSNGDSLEAKAIGQSIEDRTPDIYNAIEIYTVTDGTGRFAGASGTFTLKRLVSRTVGVASSTFEGYLLIPTK